MIDGGETDAAICFGKAYVLNLSQRRSGIKCRLKIRDEWFERLEHLYDVRGQVTCEHLFIADRVFSQKLFETQKFDVRVIFREALRSGF